MIEEGPVAAGISSPVIEEGPPIPEDLMPWDFLLGWPG